MPLIDLGKTFHLSYPRMKHEENSVHGVHEAIATGCDSIDIDLLPDMDKVIHANHWLEPMMRDGFYDPLHKMARTTKITAMHTPQVARLKTHDEYVIHTAHDLIGYMARQKTHRGRPLKGRLEPKWGGHWTPELFAQLFRTCEEADAIVVITYLDTDPKWRDVLQMAREVGFPDCRRIRG